MRVNVSASGCLCWHTGGCHSLPWMQWLPQRPPQAVTDPEAAPVVLQQPPQLEAAPGCHRAFANFVSVPASDSMNSVSARSPETWSVCFPVLQGRALCFPASLFKDSLNTKSSRVTLSDFLETFALYFEFDGNNIWEKVCYCVASPLLLTKVSKCLWTEISC